MTAPRPVIWLGGLFVALFLAARCEAADTFRIRCGEYSSARGHAVTLGSYIAYWELPLTYTTEAACGDGADAWLAHGYHGNVLPDGSRHRVIKHFFSDSELRHALAGHADGIVIRRFADQRRMIVSYTVGAR